MKFKKAGPDDLDRLVRFRQQAFKDTEFDKNQEVTDLTNALIRGVFIYAAYADEEPQFMLKLERLTNPSNIFYADSFCRSSESDNFVLLRFLRYITADLAESHPELQEVEIHYEIPTFFAFVYLKRVRVFVEMLNRSMLECIYKWLFFRRVFKLKIQRVHQ